MKHVLIAGGSGFIGVKLAKFLTENGYYVNVLTRTPREKNHFFWNPTDGVIDENCLSNVQILINLTGAGIADKRWTKARKKELLESRIESNVFLFKNVSKMPKLEHVVCSSGINSYGFDDSTHAHEETDPFGKDFLSQLVQKWEESADLFQTHCGVTKIRTSVVLGREGGALPKLIRPVQWGVGSPLGTGKQFVPWIHIHDLVGIFYHVINTQLFGVFNAVSGNASNDELTHEIAQVLHKKLWLPNVPESFINILFGEMASMLLKGVCASNKKITNSGYVFKFQDLSMTLIDLCTKEERN
jgi:uncharacterized protein (TIGR01777 family)